MTFTGYSLRSSLRRDSEFSLLQVSWASVRSLWPRKNSLWLSLTLVLKLLSDQRHEVSNSYRTTIDYRTITAHLSPGHTVLHGGRYFIAGTVNLPKTEECWWFPRESA